MKLTDGMYLEQSAGGTRGIYNVYSLGEHVAFGDLSGDGVDDAAVILTYDRGRHWDGDPFFVSCRRQRAGTAAEWRFSYSW